MTGSQERLPGEPPPEPVPGEWVVAKRNGRCVRCRGPIYIGRPIRPDGTGHYLCQDCG